VFDYVIVGAGSAGCVLANRLSEDPAADVLLLEAGGSDAGDSIQMPAAAVTLLRTDKDWDHSSGYEPHLHDRRITLPRGRVLGGTSAINFMVYVRGHRSDYDGWRDRGCTGWGWEHMLRCFKRAEDNERGADAWHGTGGPLAVSDGRSQNPIARAFVAAGVDCGLAPTDDFNGREQDGVGWYQLTQRDGLRCSTAAGYLHPVMQRPNLHVETGLQVLKVLFEGGRAVGVQGTRNGALLEFRAAREVILSAGAYHSPQLLMLSGIGRADELTALGIAPVADLPGVGRNLIDHPQCLMVYRASRPDSLYGAFNPRNLERLESERRGPLTSNGLEAGGFIRTRDDLDAPDVQLYCSVGMWVDEGTAPAPGHGFTLGASVLTPLSRGSVRLLSPDPTAKPRIVHDYFHAPEDLRAQIEGLRVVLGIAQTEPLAGYVAEPFLAPDSDSDADLTAFIRSHAQTTYHPVGTCRMGVDEDAVVDPELRVHGVDGLRIVDASIMPTIPRGNTNAPTIAVAERAAELIRARPAPARGRARHHGERAQVTVAGGGLAGLAAALRLAERGHRVKVYEAKPMLGGNLASRSGLDVYPHMYLNWYRNFWALLGGDRELHFRPMQGVKQLAAGRYPRYTGLDRPYRPWDLLRNLRDGPTAPADMYLFFYAAIDLLAETLHRTSAVDDVSVNGFLHNRPYMTERTAELYNDLIINIWGVPSYLASADDYQDFVEYSVADGSPPFWLARGPAQEQVIGRLEAKLAAAGAEVVRGVQVVGASCSKGRVREISLREGAHTRTERVDELVLALPPGALSALVRSGDVPIVRASPRIAEVARLTAQNVPLINVFFRRRLQVPAAPVGLAGSSLGLAFTDISQTWPGLDGGTVLALSSSDPYALPGTGDDDDARAILDEAARYLEFTDADIDWERTRYDSNRDALLFVNETGADVWRPKASDERLGNLSYAGDYCDNRIGMTTIESAVTSGLEAAAAIAARRGGAPVPIFEPRVLPRPLWVWMRLACMPYAASASMWSKGSDLLASAARRLQR
jgi:choline dehydrogenase-like flavoprotein